MRKSWVAIVSMALLFSLAASTLADPLPPGEYAKKMREKRKKKAPDAAPKDGDQSKGKADGKGDAKPDNKDGASPKKGS
jgi:hypothetical protein